MNLTQDIEAKLADLEGSNYPQVRDALRDAMLLLAKHLQRHDELVAIQRDIDAYAECRAMPDDTLADMDARRDEVRQQIWEETPLVDLGQCVAAVEEIRDAGREELIREVCGDLTDEQRRSLERVHEQIAGPYRELEADVAALRERGFVPAAELDAADKRAKELEEKLAYAEYVNGLLQDAEKFDRDENAELTREKDAEGCKIGVDAHLYLDYGKWRLLLTGIPRWLAHDIELRGGRSGIEFRLFNSGWPGDHSLPASFNFVQVDGVEALDAKGLRIKEIGARLAQRNADAEVGKAIRELMPKRGHHAVSFVVSIGDAGNRYARTEWLDGQRGAPWESGWQNGDDCEMAAIREYNETED